VVENESAQLALIDGGRVALGVRGLPPIEVLDLLDQTLSALVGAFPALAAVQAQLALIKGSL
jgi:hypothetical protein